MRMMLLLCAIFIGLESLAHAQRSDSIAAVVNGDIITYTDLYDRIDMVIKSAGMPDTTEFKAKLLPQVLTGLITESVQLQEADRLGHKISDEEINEGLVIIAEQNNFGVDAFRSVLENQGVNPATLEQQIKSQLAWRKVIQSEIRPRITIGDSEINSEIDQLKQKEGQEEYFLAEIFLPFGNSDEQEKIHAAAQDLALQLGQSIQNFPAAARQFSQSSSAANGGVIGWVTLDQIDTAIASILRDMSPQQVSAPVLTDNGYSILFLREKRLINLGKVESRAIYRIRTANFPLKEDQDAREAQKIMAERFAREVTGCLDIVKRTTNQRDVTLNNINGLESDIAPDIMESVKSLSVGEAGSLVMRPNEIIVPMLCGREGGQTGIAALEQEVEQRIGLQRIDTLQRRLLRDLITNAYIERRV